jgi:hypothetical protein
MSGNGRAVWESQARLGQAVWVSSSGQGEAVWMSKFHNGQAVWISQARLGKAVWIAGCFPKTTPIRMSTHKPVPIESIQVGDVLRSWDIHQQQIQSTVVTQIHHHQALILICINDILEVSSSQPLLVVESSDISNLAKLHWKYADALAVGNTILGYGGELIPVESVRAIPVEGSIDVMHLSTEGGASFFVDEFLVRAFNDLKIP